MTSLSCRLDETYSLLDTFSSHSSSIPKRPAVKLGCFPRATPLLELLLEFHYLVLSGFVLKLIDKT